MISQPSLISKRLVSIDALRGFDMLMICGADAFFRQWQGKTDFAWVDMLSQQFEHPAWFGFSFYDFIFPLFLFIAGVSIPFSLSKGLEQGISKNELYKKAFIRMLILIGLGMLDKNAPFPFFDWPHIRLGSVLGRIGLAGFITIVLYLNFNSIKRLYIIGGILLFYYACVMWIPVPGYGAGDLSFEGNLIGWIDRTLLPGRLLQGTYDELGIFTQLPSFCLTLLGASTGDILRKNAHPDWKKFIRLLLISGICIVIGLIWSLHFPISKHLWSSSFILLTGGMSIGLMAVFYGVIDILNVKKWSFFFVVIGMNSLAIYMLYRFVNFRYTSRMLFEGLYINFDEKWHSVFETFGSLVLVWILLYFLYRKKIFFKI